MFKRGYILGRKGRFWDQKTLHIITKMGGGRSYDGGVDLIMIHNLIWTRLLICI